MYPVLFHIGPYTAFTYGFVVFWAYSIPLFLAWTEAKKAGIPPRTILIPAYLSGLIGLAGARLMGMAVHQFQHPVPHSLEYLILHSGSAYVGGLIASLLTCLVYARLARQSFWKLLDFAAPYIALGEGIGRIGCLFAGCCFGIPYEGPLALPAHIHPGTASITGVFPWQPLAALVGFATFGLLLSLRRRSAFPGQLGLLFIALYSITRGLLEFLRGDSARGVWLGGQISSSQLASLVLLAGSLALLAWKWKSRSRPGLAEGK